MSRDRRSSTARSFWKKTFRIPTLTLIWFSAGKPVVARLWSVMKPGGMLLAFFHTREAGPDAPYYRYHLTGTDTLEMHALNAKRDNKKGHPTKTFALQRVFNNRHIENLFRDFGSIKFFLSRDNIREVLVVR
jgi:hypothetical protein